MFLSHVVAKALALSHGLYMKTVICKMIVFMEMGFVDETVNNLNVTVTAKRLNVIH